MQQEFLQACVNCCGTGFRNRNVAARAAVKSLMLARFNLTRREFNKLAQELLTAGVIEEIPSKGTTAFRLTMSAEKVLNPDQGAAECGSPSEVEPNDGLCDADIPEACPLLDSSQPTEPDDPKSLSELYSAAIQGYGNELSDLACRFIAILQTCCQLNQIRLVDLFRFCTNHGLSHRDVRRAIGELNAMEYLFVEWCQNSSAYYVTLCNMDVPNRQIWDIVNAYSDIAKELHGAVTS